MELRPLPCVCVHACECACMLLAHVRVSLLVSAQLHLEYLFQTVCVMSMTSLSEGTFRGYTNVEEGYLYFEEIVVVSDLAYLSLIWLGHGLILTFF